MKKDLTAFVEASQDTTRVSGLTHDFYRYPARFSPVFAREAIRAFSRPGDVVLDPFVGGGTTLVEASYLGRRSLGLDVSSLAAFVSTVKTTPLTPAAAEWILKWAGGSEHLRSIPMNSGIFFVQAEHLRNNLGDRQTWRLRNAIASVLSDIQNIPESTIANFLRCSLLRTAQWALDGRAVVPSVGEFRRRLSKNITEMVTKMMLYSEQISANRVSGLLWQDGSVAKVLNKPATEIGALDQIAENKPSLVLTSPPYPGVHVLYHRWQVQGRRETAAPFWIADRADGNPISTYTLDNRKSKNHDRYFEHLLAIYSRIWRAIDRRTTIVQLIAFSDAGKQLPRYLKMMSEAGFREMFVKGARHNGRIWRPVPNRRWYASQRGDIDASREVVLVHRKAQR